MRLWLFLLILLAFGSSHARYPALGLAQVSASPSVPLQTDDGLDPITLIWTGYAPTWWVAANLYGWSDTAYCSSAKPATGAAYNYTLEQPDSGATSCLAPRDPVPISDIGDSPVSGWGRIGAARREP